jgi:molecular chaperone Hsp33
MTIDAEGAKDRYQGVVAIEGETLALCAEQYFAQSEQTPTRLRLAVGRLNDGAGEHWRAGGLMIQNIAGDEDTRMDAPEDWERAEALFATVGEDELIDPRVAPETLLYRLFHEDGVRLFPAKPLRAFCRCSHDRVVGMLRTFPKTDQDEMTEADGRIHVTCEYCSKTYTVEPEAVAAN